MVAPAATELGILPGVPLLGALPVGRPGQPAAAAVAGSGALAGGLAAARWWSGRGRPRDSTRSSLVGGLAGVLAALVFVGLAWAAGGDLGRPALAGLGPRLVPLLVMAGPPWAWPG